MKELQIGKDISNIIKGISCLLIVAHHFCSWLDGKGIDNFFVHFIGVRGGVIGVTIFFFLSGWGLSESQKKNKYPLAVYAKRRLSKVFIPLLLTNIIYISILLVFKKIHFSVPTLLLKSLNLKLCDGVLWFCNVILFFYLVFYFSFLPATKWVKVVICLSATVLYSIAATLIYPDSPFYVYSIIGFPLGMILSLYKDVALRIQFWGTWSLFLILFLVIGAFLLPAYNNLFLMNLASLFIVALIVFSVVISSRVGSSRKLVVLPFIGMFSYEIYLLHNKVLFPLAQNGYLYWYPIAFLLIVLPLSMLLKRITRF